MTYLLAYYTLAVVALSGVLSRKIAIILVAMLTFVVSALRFNAGYDYFNYVHIIQEENFGRFEWVTKPLMMVSAELGFPQLFFIVNSAVTIGFFAASLLCANRKFPVSRIGILFFVAFPVGLVESFGMVRQFSAISIFVFAFVVRRKILLSLGAIVLATGFHISVVFWIPVLVLFIFNVREFTALIYLSVLSVSFFSASALRSLSEVTGIYSWYFSNHTSGFGWGVLSLFLLAFVLLLFFDGAHKRRWSAEFNLFFVGMCVYVGLIPYGVHLARVGWYGLAIYPILFGAALAGRSSGLKLAAVVICSGVYLSHFYFAAKNETWNSLWHYEPYILVDARSEAEWIEKYGSK